MSPPVAEILLARGHRINVARGERRRIRGGARGHIAQAQASRRNEQSHVVPGCPGIVGESADLLPGLTLIEVEQTDTRLGTPDTPSPRLESRHRVPKRK
jgi:hypothetical protein